MPAAASGPPSASQASTRQHTNGGKRKAPAEANGDYSASASVNGDAVHEHADSLDAVFESDASEIAARAQFLLLGLKIVLNVEESLLTSSSASATSVWTFLLGSCSGNSGTTLLRVDPAHNG